MKRHLLFDQAKKLRMEGLSLLEIATELGIAKSTASLWMRNIQQPEDDTTRAHQAEKMELRKVRIRAARAETRRKREPRRLIGGGYRWLIPAPPGYQGTTYGSGRYIYEHRYIMEQKLGRLLRRDEVVHHINGDKLDNRVENLELTTQPEHMRRHVEERGLTGRLFSVLLCPNCHNTFERVTSEVCRNLRTGKKVKLNFCGRKCSAAFYSKIKHVHNRNVVIDEALRRNIVSTYKKTSTFLSKFDS